MYQVSKLPAMPFWVIDYEKDTLDLTPEEDGIYGRFIRQCWIGRGQMPDDDAEIARRCRIDVRVWKRVRKKLGERVIAYGTSPLSYVSNKRVSKEWNYAMSYAAAQATKGKRSAAIRQARALELQTLKHNHGSTAVKNNGSAGVPTGAPTGRPTGSQPLLKEDILTSSKDAAREEAADPPEEKAEGGGPATALPTGAPSRPENIAKLETPPASKSYLLETGLMRGETPYLPKQTRRR